MVYGKTVSKLVMHKFSINALQKHQFTNNYYYFIKMPGTYAENTDKSTQIDNYLACTKPTTIAYRYK